MKKSISDIEQILIKLEAHVATPHCSRDRLMQILLEGLKKVSGADYATWMIVHGQKENDWLNVKEHITSDAYLWSRPEDKEGDGLETPAFMISHWYSNLGRSVRFFESILNRKEGNTVFVDIDKSYSRSDDGKLGHYLSTRLKLKRQMYCLLSIKTTAGWKLYYTIVLHSRSEEFAATAKSKVAQLLDSIKGSLKDTICNPAQCLKATPALSPDSHPHLVIPMQMNNSLKVHEEVLENPLSAETLKYIQKVFFDSDEAGCLPPQVFASAAVMLYTDDLTTFRSARYCRYFKNVRNTDSILLVSAFLDINRLVIIYTFSIIHDGIDPLLEAFYKQKRIKLTKSQSETLDLALKYEDYDIISAIRGCKKKTVYNHINEICKKFGIKGREQDKLKRLTRLVKHPKQLKIRDHANPVKWDSEKVKNILGDLDDKKSVNPT